MLGLYVNSLSLLIVVLLMDNTLHSYQ